jgi:predicted flap endonuclease-1-like 5' DNA nuclease
VHQIGEVEDIDAANEAKLKGLEISTTDDFLTRVATPAARSDLAAAIGVDAKEILVWANCADLMRIDGVGMQFADLLEAAGVDTIPELAQRNAANLHEKLAAVNAEGKLTGRAPTSAEVEAWIVQAKALPRILEYAGGASPGAPAAPVAPASVAPASVEPAAAPPPPPAPPATPVAAASAAAPVSAVAPAPPSAPPPPVSAPSEAAPSAAPSASADAGDASRTVREFSRSDSLAEGRTWLQKLVDKVRGKA